MTLAYANSAALACTLASLATTSADPPVGRESDSYDVATSNLPDDLLLDGKITTGTSPTASRKIEIWCWGSAYDGSARRYPAGVTGSDAGLTPSSWWRDVMFPVLVINTSSTSNVTYTFSGISLLSKFRGLFLPERIGLFVHHNTGVNLHATGSNHELRVTKVTR